MRVRPLAGRLVATPDLPTSCKHALPSATHSLAEGRRLDSEFVDRASWLVPAALAHPDLEYDNVIAGTPRAHFFFLGWIVGPQAPRACPRHSA